MALTILGITFFGLLILGVPVAFAIGLSACARSSTRACRSPSSSSR